jgi:phosphatidylglycerol lysyltransferase
MNKSKNAVQNLAVGLLVLIGIKNILVALPLKATQTFAHFYKTFIHPNEAVLHHTLSFLLGLLMLLLAYRLYKRVRLAWMAEVGALALTVVLHLLRNHRFAVPIVIIELFVLIVLCISHQDFQRKSDPITVKKALGFIAVSLILLLMNATMGVYMMKGHLANIHDVSDALLSSVKLLVLLDTDVVQTTGKVADLYIMSLIIINWICILSFVSLLLKPLIYTPIITKHDRERVRKLALSYGQNPVSYLALETDKKFFFSSKVNGVCAYTIANDVFLISGDILCNPEDAQIFLQELFVYCNQNAYQIMLINMTDQFRDLYAKAGFCVVKYGEDAFFELENYHLVGGKVAKVRAAINHATKAGISVVEYKPLSEKNELIEKQMEQITEEWLTRKGGYEMHFTMGGTGLSDPMDRRYFYACDEAGTMLGFVVFLPYINGYLADVTRRKNTAPQGVLEKIIYKAFTQFKEEGIGWGNMGLSPLYNVADHDKSTMTEKLFNYIYENLNNSYGFKQLHHAKEKYAPTHWVPRYLAYYPHPFSPKLAYALVRCQIKEGILQVLLGELLPQKDNHL